MNKAARLILGLIVLLIASMLAVAEQTDALFFNIEDAIRQKEPEWTLMNRWPAPQGQAIGFLWRLDQHEIFVWIVRQRSTAEMLINFQDDGLGRSTEKSTRRKLNIGDECYLRQSARSNLVVAEEQLSRPVRF